MTILSFASSDCSWKLWDNSLSIIKHSQGKHNSSVSQHWCLTINRIDRDQDRRISVEEFTSKNIRNTIEKVMVDFLVHNIKYNQQWPLLLLHFSGSVRWTIWRRSLRRLTKTAGVRSCFPSLLSGLLLRILIWTMTLTARNDGGGATVRLTTNGSERDCKCYVAYQRSEIK